MNENLEDLFRRIEYPKKTVQFSDLSLLMKQFAYHLPFENVDIMMNRKTLLEYDALYHKMIHNKRGGLCYELNPLLFYTLQELGFDVQMIHATIIDRKSTRLNSSHVSTSYAGYCL